MEVAAEITINGDYLMKRSAVYSVLVFVCILVEIISQPITDIVMGYPKQQVDWSTVLLFSTFGAAIVAIIFFALFQWIGTRLFRVDAPSGYRPGRLFASTAALLIVAAAGIGVVVTIIHGPERIQAQANIDRAAKAVADSQENERQRLTAMTPEARAAETKKKDDAVNAVVVKMGDALLVRVKEHYVWANAFIEGKNLKRPTSRWVGQDEWIGVQTKLKLITTVQSHYQKAQTLLRAMSADEKKFGTITVASLAFAAAETRKEFANKLEQGFVEKGRMNADVTTSGPQNTVLSIRWALASKVTAHDLSESGIVTKAKGVGFKKIVYTDGYNFSWEWK